MEQQENAVVGHAGVSCAKSFLADGTSPQLSKFLHACMHGVQEVRRAGAAPIPWQVPKLRRPAVCDQLDAANVNFVSMYENHPCCFLPA